MEDQIWNKEDGNYISHQEQKEVQYEKKQEPQQVAQTRQEQRKDRWAD